jgi:hypothetical protein
MRVSVVCFDTLVVSACAGTSEVGSHYQWEGFPGSGCRRDRSRRAARDRAHVLLRGKAGKDKSGESAFHSKVELLPVRRAFPIFV